LETTVTTYAASSTFDVITELAAGTGDTINIAGPIRPGRVIGIYGTGVDTATITVSKVDVTGLIVTQLGVVTIDAAVAGLNDAPAVLDVYANRAIVAGDTLRIVRGVANSTRVVIRFASAGTATYVES
jgi:hypothetical protein